MEESTILDRKALFIKRIRYDNEKVDVNKLLYVKEIIEKNNLEFEEKVKLLNSLSFEEKEKLEEMYDEQIKKIKNNLNIYKNKILRLKNT